MLLIDARGKTVHAMPVERATAPLLPLPRGTSRVYARAVLLRAARGDASGFQGLWQALRQELRAPLGTDRADLLEAAARGIAGGSILAASLLPTAPDISFPVTETLRDPFNRVLFPGLAVAKAFATALLARPEVATALQDCWAHGARIGARPKDDAPRASVAALAAAFANHILLLRPAAPDGQMLQLRWRATSTVSGGVETAAPPPPPPPPPPRPARPPPPQRRPPQPPSPQAQALLAAAQAGAPFCEECAKRAAGHG